MSERMTAVNPVKGARGERWFGVGYMDYGRRTRPEMIAEYRRHYEHQLAEAQRALALTDDELVVTTFLGVHIRKKREVVLEVDR